ncbi:hypothetical protein MKX03_036333 [Papaver bracteatum]|nr:hypothetical protein MKX03_036333 [Papaver bracteatum]
MKKMSVKSVLVACITLFLLTSLTDAARVPPLRGPASLVTGYSPASTGSKAVATDGVAYPQECPCCKWGYSGPFYLCQMICCKT